MKLVIIALLFMMGSCANKNEPLDNITEYVENISLCANHGICEEGKTKESIRAQGKEVFSEMERLELLALKEGFTKEQISAASSIGINNAKEIARKQAE